MTVNKTLADVFDDRAPRLGSHPAVRDAEREWTYSDLLAWSQEISRQLSGPCREPGRRVALMLPNSAAFVAAFFGIARLGGVIAPMSVRYRSQELLYYLRDSQATAFVVAPDGADQALEVLEQLEHPPVLLEVTADGGCRVLRERGDRAVPGARAEAGPLLLQYTSGSTGPPKRVIRTHAHLLFELERLARAFELSEEDRFLGAAPFSHVNGLVRTMMSSMFVGATLYPVAEFRRRDVMRLIGSERITFFGGVPYMFAILAQTPLRGEVDFSSLRIAFSASAPLLVKDNRAFQAKYGIYVRQLYGSSETGTISVNLHPNVEQCLESVGLPLDDVRVAIVDDEGGPLPAGEEGEVVIASPGAITDYEDNPDANRSAFRDGFYLSGDLGRKDSQGYLTLTGRKKFLINRGGYKVNPLEVEEAVQSHPSVKEVVVVGAPGPHGDDLVRCVVVREAPCTEEDIVNHCKTRIANFKVPSRIEFRETLPKSDTGKILRQKL